MKNTFLVSTENDIDFQLMHRVFYNESSIKQKAPKTKMVLYALLTVNIILFIYLIKTT